MTAITDQIVINNYTTQPPEKSRNIISDVRNYFFKKPHRSTLVKIQSEEDRKKYGKLILKRTGIGVDKYRMLNIHNISIEAPAEFVFDELLTWDGDSIWWPNHLAKPNLKNGNLEKIRITLFGLSQNLFKNKNGFGFSLLHLFNLNAIKIRKDPDEENGRYLLYKCSGGYPIGIFSMYVRDSMPEIGEHGESQFFAVVGFNFYGSRNLSKLNILNKTWESIHNRVTSNILQRLKLKCEWDYNQR